jgi:hypothetical protein
MATPGICGDKSYASDQVLAVVAAPASGLLSTDYWTLTTFTNLLADVGVYTVTISATLPSYPTVVAGTTTYTLTVVDPCATVVVDNLQQAISTMIYVVMLATTPTTTTFVPFSDNAAVTYSNPSICGPKVYTILEAYPFVSIGAPASGLNWTDLWSLTLQTSLLSDVGSYMATIACTLANYPAVPAVNAYFAI